MAKHRNKRNTDAAKLARHLAHAAAQGIVGKVAEAITHDGRRIEIHLDERGGVHEMYHGQDVTDPAILEQGKQLGEENDDLVSAESALQAAERTMNDALNLLLSGDGEAGFALAKTAFGLLDEADESLKDAEGGMN